MNRKYDAVVIGAGNGGLIAAAKLAKEGKKTLLVERHNLPGGYATSFVRGRFEFEASLHELCGIAPFTGGGALTKIFEDLGVADRIDWVTLDEAFRVITLNDDENIDYCMPLGKEKFLDQLEVYVPGGRALGEQLFDLCEKISSGVNFLGTIDAFSTDIIKSVFKEHMTFINTAGYTVNQVFEALNAPKAIRDIFGAYWCYLGVNLDELNFLHYFIMLHSYLVEGAVIPKYRSHMISSVLLDRFEELGGDAWFNTAVTKILVKDKTAYGVILDDGTRIDADYVISDVAPYNVFTKLIDKAEVPAHQMQDYNAKRLAVKGFAVFLGLNRSAEALGLKNHTYFIYDSADTKKVAELSRTRDQVALQATVCLNAAIPDCSPEGTCILYMTSVFEGDDAWSDVTPATYMKEKRRYAEMMLNDFEKATGCTIKPYIEEIEIAAPMTYARYADAPNGTIYGYEAEGTNGIVHRIMTASMGEQIKRLGFCGGYTQQAIGFSPSYQTGMLAAEAAISVFEKEGASK